MIALSVAEIHLAYLFPDQLARASGKVVPGLKAPDPTQNNTVPVAASVILGLPISSPCSAGMERPLEDATTANLWKTLFALVVELSLRSGLVTEEELVPALEAQSANCQEEDPQGLQEDGDGLQETGEESCKEEDPVVEVVQEPDAEKEPSRNTEEGPTSESAAPSAPAQESSQRAEDGDEVSLHNRLSSQEEDISQQTALQHSYPPEYNPFDRPVDEVVAQLFDDSQPVNPPPAKRQR